MAFDPRDYHPDWKSISRQIKEQADGKCELCGVPNGEYVERDRRNPMRWGVLSEGSAEVAHLEGGWVTKIVLTVHHQCDCDKRVCRDPSHLVCLCQKCHLNADRPHHLRVQAENRLAKKLAAQPLLFGEVT